MPVAPRSVVGTETVLVVDDEPDVRYFLEVILKSNGYHVLAGAQRGSRTGDAAVAAPEQVHLLFSDIGLPTIDGFELCRRMRQIEPGVKTILCSGYTDGGLKTKMAEEGIDAFVPKPYDMSRADARHARRPG